MFLTPCCRSLTWPTCGDGYRWTKRRPSKKNGAALPGVKDGVRPPVTDVFCGVGRAQGAGEPPEKDAPGGMVPSASRNRPKDHGGDAEESNALVPNHADVPLHVV